MLDVIVIYICGGFIAEPFIIEMLVLALITKYVIYILLVIHQSCVLLSAHISLRFECQTLNVYRIHTLITMVHWIQARVSRGLVCFNLISYMVFDINIVLFSVFTEQWQFRFISVREAYRYIVKYTLQHSTGLIEKKCFYFIIFILNVFITISMLKGTYMKETAHQYII